MQVRESMALGNLTPRIGQAITQEQLYYIKLVANAANVIYNLDALLSAYSRGVLQVRR